MRPDISAQHERRQRGSQGVWGWFCLNWSGIVFSVLFNGLVIYGAWMLPIVFAAEEAPTRIEKLDLLLPGEEAITPQPKVTETQAEITPPAHAPPSKTRLPVERKLELPTVKVLFPEPAALRQPRQLHRRVTVTQLRPPSPSSRPVPQRRPSPVRLIEEKKESKPQREETYGRQPVLSLVRNTKPHYPALARQQGLEGTVMLRLEIARNGQVQGVALVASSGHPLLDREAMETAKKWRYAPISLPNGKATTTTRVPFVFMLQEQQ